MKKIVIGLFALSLSLATVLAYGEGNDEYTVLLLHFNGDDGSTNFIDDSVAGGHTVTANGDAQIDTSESRFGGSSAELDGDGDYLTVPDSDDWYFGTGDFTIDFWVRFGDYTAGYHQYFLHQYDNANNTWYFIKHYDGVSGYRLNFYCVKDGVIKADYIMTNSWSLFNDTWYHIALVRNGTSLKMYINGISQELTESTAIASNDLGNYVSPLYIGCRYTPTHYFNRWIEELRISKGIARWTSDFIPPTEEYDEFVDTDPPIADAGDDIFVYPGDTVTLDGSNSYDPDGTIENYSWKRLLDDTVLYSGSDATFQAQTMGWIEEVIELTVTDNLGATSTDTVSIIDASIGNIGDLESQVSAIQQENSQQQQTINENRYLLEQLPQLRHDLEDLDSLQLQTTQEATEMQVTIDQLKAENAVQQQEIQSLKSTVKQLLQGIPTIVK